jgi:glycosyltransferase involved in cell wall biosynthesis
MTDILLVRSNSLVKSPRVTKIARSIGKAYKSRAIGWNREQLGREKINLVMLELDLFNFKAPIGKPTIIAYLPFFWLFIFYNLMKIRPSIVHACDLDTIPPCYLYKKMFRKKLVFDVCDRYAMSKIPTSKKTIFSLVNRLEEYYAPRVDCLINVSEKLAATFTKRPQLNAIVMNCADDTTTQSNPDNKNKENNVFRLVYTGNIVRLRGIEQIVQAISDLDNVELNLAGNVIDNELLNRLLLSNKNVKYKGILSLLDALALEAASDAMIILYDPSVPNNRYAMPNKLFESMMFGIPLITNVAAEIVKKVDCGIFVEYKDTDEIRNAVISLRDNIGLRKRLGANGRAAFEQEYNWAKMEKRLYDVYNKLLKKKRLDQN